jgi:hypothetical protein
MDDPLRTRGIERMFVAMDRLHELESMRRSIAMLQPGTKALSREEAMRLIAELQDVEGRLKRLKNGLQRLVAEDG